MELIRLDIVEAIRFNAMCYRGIHWSLVTRYSNPVKLLPL